MNCLEKVTNRKEGTMEYLFIYGLQLADILNTISKICIGAFIVNTIGMVPAFIYKDEEADAKKWFDILRKIFIALLTIIILGVLAPTKQTLLLMGGTYYSKKAVTSVVTSDKLQKVNTIIDLQLDKYIKELKEVKSNDR